jgi:nitronate monooxygenase
MLRTWLTETFGLDVPVVGAPMAGAGSGPLAAAVSANGGLGMVGAGGAATPEWIAQQAAVASAPGRPWGIGLMAWVLPDRPEQLDAVVAAKPALVSVSFGPYADAVHRLQDNGIRVATQVGTVQEAAEARDVGVDLVVARGAEGGGHGRGDVGTLTLLQAVLEEVDLPVVAAGGIGTARGLAAVLAAGAAGAWVGTAFLTCREAETTPAARDRLFEASEADTAYGRVFDVAQRLGWPPEYGGRALRNAFFDRWEGREDDLARDDAAVAELAEGRRRQDLDVGYVYAGQGVGLLRHERSAAEVLADLAGAEDLLRGWGA